MPIITISEGVFDGSRADRFSESTRRFVEASRREAGCVAFLCGIDVVVPDRVHVAEIWESRSALEAHLRSPHYEQRRLERGELGLSFRPLARCEVPTLLVPD
jgi:quinol monooxygenase YgiN